MTGFKVLLAPCYWPSLNLQGKSISGSSDSRPRVMKVLSASRRSRAEASLLMVSWRSHKAVDYLLMTWWGSEENITPPPSSPRWTRRHTQASPGWRWCRWGRGRRTSWRCQQPRPRTCGTSDRRPPRQSKTWNIFFLIAPNIFMTSLNKYFNCFLPSEFPNFLRFGSIWMCMHGWAIAAKYEKLGPESNLILSVWDSCDVLTTLRCLPTLRWFCPSIQMRYQYWWNIF